MPDIVTLRLAQKYTDQEVAGAVLDAGSGDVVGPGSATASNLAAFDGTTGKLLADSGVAPSAFATAAQGAKADAALPKVATVNSYAGNRTLDGDDSGAYVRITAAGTVTLPDGRSTGFQAVIVNATDSDTVALSAATTLTIPAGFETEVQNRRAVTVIHVGSNVWEAHGALVESE